MSYPVLYVPAGDVVPILFSSYAGSTGASVTLTGLAVTDIEIYKDGSTTQRASDAGYTLLDTDGIDFDGITGIHGFSIDTGDNTDASFYTVGAWFTVVVSAVTIDSQTVSFIAAMFRIMPAETVAGKPKVDVDTFGGTAGTFSGGRAEVNTSHIAGSAVSTSSAQIGVNVVNAGGTAWGSGAITAASIATNAIDADAIAADAVTEIQAGLSTLDAAGIRTAVGLAAANLDTQLTAIDDYLDTEIAAIKAKTDNLPASPAAVGDIPSAATIADAVWDEGLSGHLGAGSTGNALNAAGSSGDPWATSLPGAYGAGSAGKILGDNLNATIASRASQASVDTIDGVVDAILVDTAEIGVAGAGLTNINLPDQTMNITGTLSGSVGSVTGAVTVGALSANVVTAAALASDAVAEIQAGLSTLDAAGVRAAVGLASANLDTQLDALPTAIENADALLDRNMATGADNGTDSTAVRTPRQALRALRNKVTVSGGVATITKEDDVTASWTASVTTTAGNPLSGVDPT